LLPDNALVRRPLSVLGIVAIAFAGCTEPAARIESSSSPLAVVPPTPSVVQQPLLPGDATYAARPTGRYVEMRERLDDPTSRFLLDTQNPTMRLAPLLVTDARRDASGEPWYRVLMPVKPNGSSAWARGTDVRLVPREQRIVVDLSRRTLGLYRDGALVHRLSVGVGTPAAPTAVGTFYVWVRVRYSTPTGPYGPLALGLSGFSEVLSEWPGGGRMAIHGTSDPNDRGRAVSHGCVRVYNGDLGVIRHVPLGTPVVIRP
jgi:lipoprotein-anchoring transpeptidase ErfK/SrfK